MPQFINVNALEPASKVFVRPLSAPLPRNPVLLKPTPHQHFLAMPKSKIPPNVRIQNYIVDHRSLWHGMNEVEKRGGRVTKDWGKAWREGKGREARKMGGIKWAVRER